MARVGGHPCGGQAALASARLVGAPSGAQAARARTRAGGPLSGSQIAMAHATVSGAPPDAHAGVEAQSHQSTASAYSFSGDTLRQLDLGRRRRLRLSCG